MTFTLNVNIGLTPQLAGFISTLLGGCQAQPTPVEQPVTANEAKAAIPLPEQPAAQATIETTEAVAAPAEATIETAEQETVEETAGVEEREYTEADVRAAIDRARCRIEGEDWRDNPDGAGYKQWHRAMTSWFKVTSALFGADRPSELPDSRSRMNFIRCCDDVEIRDGALVEAVPF